ncbi:MAG: hypothetical protein NZT61_02845 [Deltaproteobacteria bacterium]|nr:hypothetical protein [Deltaproteobacteria bacterium]
MSDQTVLVFNYENVDARLTSGKNLFLLNLLREITRNYDNFAILGDFPEFFEDLLKKKFSLIPTNIDPTFERCLFLTETLLKPYYYVKYKVAQSFFWLNLPYIFSLDKDPLKSLACELLTLGGFFLFVNKLAYDFACSQFNIIKQKLICVCPSKTEHSPVSNSETVLWAPNYTNTKWWPVLLKMKDKIPVEELSFLTRTGDDIFKIDISCQKQGVFLYLSDQIDDYFLYLLAKNGIVIVSHSDQVIQTVRGSVKVSSNSIEALIDAIERSKNVRFQEYPSFDNNYFDWLASHILENFSNHR